MISIKLVLIQHMLDQSRFPDDLKTNLLKEIERMDKPNVEVLLNMLRLYQKMQGSNGGKKLVSMMDKRTRVKRVWVYANV